MGFFIVFKGMFTVLLCGTIQTQDDVMVEVSERTIVLHSGEFEVMLHFSLAL